MMTIPCCFFCFSCSSSVDFRPSNFPFSFRSPGYSNLAMVIFVSSHYVTKPVPLAFHNFFTDFPSNTSAEQFTITYNIWPENFINPSQALGLKGVECLLVSFSHFPCFASQCSTLVRNTVVRATFKVNGKSPISGGRSPLTP